MKHLNYLGQRGQINSAVQWSLSLFSALFEMPAWLSFNKHRWKSNLKFLASLNPSVWSRLWIAPLAVCLVGKVSSLLLFWLTSSIKYLRRPGFEGCLTRSPRYFNGSAQQGAVMLWRYVKSHARANNLKSPSSRGMFSNGLIEPVVTGRSPSWNVRFIWVFIVWVFIALSFH